MPNAPNDKDQEKGDELLKRLLKTPPKPHKEKDSGRRNADKSSSSVEDADD